MPGGKFVVENRLPPFYYDAACYALKKPIKIDGAKRLIPIISKINHPLPFNLKIWFHLIWKSTVSQVSIFLTN